MLCKAQLQWTLNAEELKFLIFKKKKLFLGVQRRFLKFN